MFGKKADPPESKYETADTAKACLECGCIVLTEKMKTVRVNGTWSPRADYYCTRCKPPYDEIEYNRDTGGCRYFRSIPASLVQVTEDGKEVKPKKAVK